MCPTQRVGEENEGSWRSLKGVLGGKETRFQFGNGDNRLQALVFYPSDWEEDSVTLLSSFSQLQAQFQASTCTLYGCSTDSTSSHLQWLKAELGHGLKFPLLSDPAGLLADRFDLFDSEERLCQRGFVITDSSGEQLETVVSGLEGDAIAKLALNIVKQVSPTHESENQTQISKP